MYGFVLLATIIYSCTSVLEYTPIDMYKQAQYSLAIPSTLA